MVATITSVDLTTAVTFFPGLSFIRSADSSDNGHQFDGADIDDDFRHDISELDRFDFAGELIASAEQGTGLIDDGLKLYFAAIGRWAG